MMVKHKAKVAHLATSAAGDAKERAEEDLSRVQEALAATEEGRCKAEAGNARLEVEWTSFLLKLGATKDEVSSFHSQVGRDKEAIKEEYHKALKVIFANGYRCCVFKHNICGDYPEVLDGMPDSADPLLPNFFVNPGCPPVQVAVEAIATKAPLSETAWNPWRMLPSRTRENSSPFFSVIIFKMGLV